MPQWYYYSALKTMFNYSIFNFIGNMLCQISITLLISFLNQVSISYSLENTFSNFKKYDTIRCDDLYSPPYIRIREGADTWPSPCDAICDRGLKNPRNSHRNIHNISDYAKQFKKP